jgi:hypothetical protein
MIDIKKSADIEIEKTRAVILGFPWENATAYATWLAQTYYMVNHSTRLVALAGAYTPLDRNELHARFVDHAKEERGHQLICISDLKALGHEIKSMTCFPQSAAMYQVQYYWIQHVSAVAFFGYTLSLEHLAAEFGAEVFRRAESAHGKNATKFLKVHAHDDVEHIAKAFEQLSKLSQPELTMVCENLTVSAALYRSMLGDISAQVGRPATLKAA